MLNTSHSQERETIIARSVTGFVSELRLVDVEHYIAFITLQMLNHVDDLVKSASEHHFVPGFVTLGNGCEIDVGWDRAPTVTLDFIMHLGWGKVYFSVRLAGSEASVRLDYFAIDHPALTAEDNTQRLRDTVAVNLLIAPTG